MNAPFDPRRPLPDSRRMEWSALVAGVTAALTAAAAVLTRTGDPQLMMMIGAFGAAVATTAGIILAGRAS